MTLPDLSASGDAVTLGTLDLSGADPRWVALNPRDLTLPARKVRRNSRDSVGPYGRRSARIERRVDLRVLVTGTVDSSGDPATNSGEQLEENIDTLRAGTIDAAEDEFGCIPCTIERRGVTLSGDVQVDDMAVSHNPSADAVVFLQITLPTGRLEAEEGS